MVPSTPALSQRPTVKRPRSACSIHQATVRGDWKWAAWLWGLKEGMPVLTTGHVDAVHPDGLAMFGFGMNDTSLPSSSNWLTLEEVPPASISIMISKPVLSFGVILALPDKM